MTGIAIASRRTTEMLHVRPKREIIVDLTNDTSSSSSSSSSPSSSSDIDKVDFISNKKSESPSPNCYSSSVIVKKESVIQEPLSDSDYSDLSDSLVKSEPVSSSPIIKTETISDSEIHDYILVKTETSTPSAIKSELNDSLSIDNYNLLNSLLHQQQQQQQQASATLQFPSTKKTTNRKPKLKYRPPNGTVLDLTNVDFSQNLHDQIEIEDLSFLHHALTYSRKMVAITGAGISVGSGIPDFRSSNGLFNDLASKGTGSGKNLFDYNLFRSPEMIGKFEKMIKTLHQLSNSSKPSLFHQMINSISEQGRLQRLYTQNIDCLEVQLPYLQTEVPLAFKQPFPKTIQLHGNINLLNCSKCHYIKELNDDYFKDKPSGERTLIRTCPECEEMNEVRAIAGKRPQSAGILRPRIVLYNEFHPDGEVIGNITESDLKAKPDCLIISGTTLKIPGVRRLVKEMAKVVHSKKGYIVWINLEEPSQSIVDYVEYFDLIVVGDCQMVPGLVSLYDTTVVNAPKKRRVKKEVTKKSIATKSTPKKSHPKKPITSNTSTASKSSPKRKTSPIANSRMRKKSHN